MEILQSFGLPIVMIGLAVAAFSVSLMFARNYRKCPPNRVMVVYGRKSRNVRVDERGERKVEDRGYRLITGGSAFVVPLLESVTEIGLNTFSVEPSVTDTPNKDGVPVSVEATANVKVSSTPELLSAAVERMLGKTPQEIHSMLKVTLDGLLRQIIGTLTVEEIITDRERLQQEVLKGAQSELKKLGFEVDVFVVNKVWDKEGYIEALGAKRTAEVKRDAEIAQADAKREALVKSSAADQAGQAARLAADEKIAEANRDLNLKQAAFKKETETANAEAEMARALKTAEIDKDLKRRQVEAQEAETQARIKLAEQEAQRREQELIAVEIKPAEAKARAATITAEGNASAAIKQAEATKAAAEAQKVKLTLEGEGQAAAEAAQKRLLGLAEAEAVRARGMAEGEAIQAKLTAEATGLQKKNEALAKMSDAARLIIVLERMPEIIERVGEAGEKVVGSAFEHIGAGMSRIDSIHLIDLGGNGNGNGSGADIVSNFALTIPKTVFGVLAQAKALGLNFDELLVKLGVSPDMLNGILSEAQKMAPGRVSAGEQS